MNKQEAINGRGVDVLRENGVEMEEEKGAEKDPMSQIRDQALQSTIRRFDKVIALANQLGNTKAARSFGVCQQVCRDLIGVPTFPITDLLAVVVCFSMTKGAATGGWDKLTSVVGSVIDTITKSETGGNN